MLHDLILSKDGALYTSFTQSVANLGELLCVLLLSARIHAGRLELTLTLITALSCKPSP